MDQNYLTAHQDISHLASKEELQQEIETVNSTIEEKATEVKTEINSTIEQKVTEVKTEVNNTIESKVTEINSTIEEKVTEVTNTVETKISEAKTEITNEIKGELPDMSQYASKEEVNAKPNVWIGSKDDYDGLGEYDNNTIYLIEIEQ